MKAYMRVYNYVKVEIIKEHRHIIFNWDNIIYAIFQMSFFLYLEVRDDRAIYESIEIGTIMYCITGAIN